MRQGLGRELNNRKLKKATIPETARHISSHLSASWQRPTWKSINSLEHCTRRRMMYWTISGSRSRLLRDREQNAKQGKEKPRAVEIRAPTSIQKNPNTRSKQAMAVVWFNLQFIAKVNSWSRSAWSNQAFWNRFYFETTSLFPVDPNPPDRN